MRQKQDIWIMNKIMKNMWAVFSENQQWANIGKKVEKLREENLKKMSFAAFLNQIAKKWMKEKQLKFRKAQLFRVFINFVDQVSETRIVNTEQTMMAIEHAEFNL